MSYTPKFDYKPLSRATVDGKRLYATPDGKKLPSVTTILDATKPEEDKRALMEWRKAVGEAKAQAITTEAANRGTRMHTYLEQYIKEGAMPPKATNPFTWASHAMAQEVVEHGLIKADEFWGIEVPLYYPGVYAGTTDCVGIHAGRQAIMDFKQSNKVKKREHISGYFLQLCAYSEAHNELYGTNINTGVILMCVKPELDANQMVKSKPQYLEFVLEGDEFEHYRNMWWQRLEQYYSKF